MDPAGIFAGCSGGIGVPSNWVLIPAIQSLAGSIRLARILHQGPRMLAEFAAALVKYPGFSERLFCMKRPPNRKRPGVTSGLGSLVADTTTTIGQRLRRLPPGRQPGRTLARVSTCKVAAVSARSARPGVKWRRRSEINGGRKRRPGRQCPWHGTGMGQPGVLVTRAGAALRVGARCGGGCRICRRRAMSQCLIRLTPSRS